jgi:hypothetical protein
MSNRDPTTGRFLMGHNGGPGRPKGSRNKLGEEFLVDLYESWLEYGKDALRTVATTDPVAYIRIIVSVIPKEDKAEERRDPFADLSDDELDAMLGLLRERLEQ